MVKRITITADNVGQRIDNFLLTHFKGVPKSRVYKALRKGEVRVNKGRIKAVYRLQLDDEVRLPPLRMADPKQPFKPSAQLRAELEKRIIHEDSGLIVLDKPSGMAVHGGTNVPVGLIEILRGMRPDATFLELVHRLDRDTSGCILIAKRRPILLELHRLLIEKSVTKQYLALVKGAWQGGDLEVDAPLLKNHLQSGERVVRVSAEGKSALTLFKPILMFPDMTLVSAFPVTGRTHQIRVHAAHIGHPIAGDQKYGAAEFNKHMKKKGLRRLFLHSAAIECEMKTPVQRISLGVLLPAELAALLAVKPVS